MKTDKELLELAANAAGYKDIKHDASGFYRVIGEHEDGTLCMTQFNPLTDDGDALRLAVKLGFAVRRISNKAMVSSSAGQFDEYCDRDSCAATRRAIVRAAAAIGEKL